MPLEPEEQQRVTVAQGYVELGMFLDANEELEKVDPDVRHVPEVLAVRVEIYSALKKWEPMQVVAKKLAQFDPDNPQLTVDWAYATRRADSIEAARLILLEAVERLPSEAVLHYNLACYDCQLGSFEAAKERLKRAFKLNLTFRTIALEDDDLRPLWESLAMPLV